LRVSARFHLSFCVADLESARAFYGGLLECPQGAVHPNAVDFSFFGHQLTCHVDPARVRRADIHTLDGNHFGAIIDPADFHRLASRFKAASVSFIVPPEVQRAGTPSERWKMIVADPSGNAIELKCYKDEAQVFKPA
jgi:extradiol dioxygenase family protein